MTESIFTEQVGQALKVAVARKPCIWVSAKLVSVPPLTAEEGMPLTSMRTATVRPVGEGEAPEKQSLQGLVVHTLTVTGKPGPVRADRLAASVAEKAL